jgi:hypothetical protein
MVVLPGRFAIVSINPTDAVSHGVRMLSFGRPSADKDRMIGFLRDAVGETPSYANGTHQVLKDFLDTL